MALATLPITYLDGQVLTASDLTQNFNALNTAVVGVANGGSGLSSGTSGGIPYFSSTTAMGSSGLLTQYGLLYGGGAAAAPVALGAMTNGQIVIGSTGAAPVVASVTAGSGITLTPGAGSLTIAAADELTGLTTIQFVRKTADQTINNSTTLTNDSVLLAALAASEIVQFECFLYVDGSAAADIKVAFTVPAGASLTWGPHSSLIADTAGNATVIDATTVSGTAQALRAGGAGTISPHSLHGFVVNGGTAGNLQLQWAQNTLTAADTTVKANSCLIVRRV